MLGCSYRTARRCSRKAREPTVGSVELPHHVRGLETCGDIGSRMWGNRIIREVKENCRPMICKYFQMIDQVYYRLRLAVTS